MGDTCNERNITDGEADPECPPGAHLTGCRNGGTCFDDTCCCVDGYEGSLCQTEILECASFPCANDGTCIDEIGSYTCLCSDEYTGVNCEYSTATTIDYETTQWPCFPRDDCMGHYTCNNETDAQECLVGWTGNDCNTRDIAANVADSECPAGAGLTRCLNGGTCFDGACCCVDGYEGVLCQTQIIECLSAPCQNGGSCQDGIGYYTCVCPSGWTGTNCERMDTYRRRGSVWDFNRREKEPDNFELFDYKDKYGDKGNVDNTTEEGTKHVTDNEEDCSVPGRCMQSDFSTKQMEISITMDTKSPCQSRPCQNGGKCENVVDDYVCHCAQGKYDIFW